MTNLIPEKRVNKLGFPVTKHVLPPSAANKTKTAIPVPSFSVVDTRGQWSDLEPMVRDYVALRTDSPEDVVHRISKLDSVVQRQVTDALLSGDDYSSFTALSVMEECKDNQVAYIMGTLSFHRAMHLGMHGDDAPGKYSGVIQRSGFSSLKSRFSFEFFGEPEGEVTQDRLDHFKAEVLSDNFDFRHVYPLGFERYAAMQKVVDNIDLVEAAIPAMTKVKAGMRHWRQEHGKSTDAPYLYVEDMMEIAQVVKDRPDSAGKFYQYARDRGGFDADTFTAMINTASPSLYEGVL